MRFRRFRSLLMLASIAALVAAPRSVGADDDDRSRWFEGRTFEKKEVLSLDGRSIECYASKDDPEGADATVDRYRFLAVRDGEVKEMYSAFLNTEGTGSHVFIFWADFGTEGTEATIVESARFDDSPASYGHVKSLLVDAVNARASWLAASELLGKAIIEAAPEARRPLALAASRALERAFAAHRTHWGLLHDLLVSYQLLLPLEAATDRGANLSFLWRDRLRIQRTAFIEAEDDEADSLARTMGACSLAEGCFALTAIAANYATTHRESYAEELLAALAALGQDHQESAGRETISTTGGDVSLDFHRCPGDPPESGVPFHRMTVLTLGPRSLGIPTPVWYSLTAERSGEKTLWALYGRVGGSGRLLRLYGNTEPSEETAKQAVLDHARAALGAGGGK